MKFIILHSAFYKVIESDQRISPAHISLYFALLHDFSINRFQSPFRLNRNMIMVRAKISSRVTYNRCMKELCDCGLIEYIPSFSPGESQVNILILD